MYSSDHHFYCVENPVKISADVEITYHDSLRDAISLQIII
jgi:hypothetical protein